ncbi:type IV pilus biogenesis/stability protein PilW [Candidatus Rariloculus sp.]|uniref:type IV pilus biogenesis/stability protein PilW n=1 Tax=Candidatus Rariloculus sp. TaxID=3101265 RepID=UPI003D0AB4BD
MNGSRINRGRLIALLTAVAFLPACVPAATGVLEAPASDEAAATANVNLGAEYLRRGRTDVALKVLKRALEIDPRLASAHSTIALVYVELGELELAEAHYRRAIRVDSGNAAAQNGYAVFLCRQNRWQDAESLFRRAADNPSYETPEAALTNAGTCARNAADVESAEAYYREALAVNPAYPDALANMLDIAWRNGDYMRARSFTQRSLAVRPADARLLWLCFHIEEELADRAAADHCATRLGNDFPDSAEFAQIRQSERYAGQ